LLFTELLELPFRQARPGGGGRAAARDALAETLLADPRLSGIVESALLALGRRRDDPALRARFAELVAAYVGSRVAASEIALSLSSLGAGALAAKTFTPGLMSLGPAMANAIVQHAAVMSFPLGPGLGALWYGLFPATAGATLVAGLSGGLMVGGAMLTAFAGMIADPLQLRLGLHRRRLLRLLDALETEMRGRGPARLAFRDAYVARLLDLVDLLRAAQRLAAP
ncbi:MAG: hypothetical protein IRY94_12035, partial [Rhodospirillaceae bacterium]|nr:hypothetical protein [Rhodospirillaceae bacterium]